VPCRFSRGQRGDTPFVELRHATGELAGQFTTGQMDILKRRCRTAMPSERGNGMQFPTCMSKVGQAEVTQCVRAEAGHTSGQSDPPHNLGPGPRGERVGMVTSRLRQEQRPPRRTDFGAVSKVGAQEFAADGRVWHDSLAPALGGLGPDAYQSMPWVDVVGAQAAQLLSPKTRVISQREHHAVAYRLAPRRIEDLAPICFIRNPGQPCLMRNQAPAAAAHAGAGCVTAPADGVVVSHALFDKVVIEQANRGESLLYSGIGQSQICLTRGRRVRAGTPRRTLG